jgi:hypothetical protein
MKLHELTSRCIVKQRASFNSICHRIWLILVHPGYGVDKLRVQISKVPAHPQPIFHSPRSSLLTQQNYVRLHPAHHDFDAEAFYLQIPQAFRQAAKPS